MRKKMLTVLAVIAAIIVVFLIVVATRPADFRVSRSVTMAAPAAALFPHVNELKKWESWSPWMKLDPKAKSTFEGPPAGKSAAMSWAGNNQVGEGKMTITESRPDELVRFRLEFCLWQLLSREASEAKQCDVRERAQVDVAARKLVRAFQRDFRLVDIVRGDGKLCIVVRHQ